MMMMKWASVVAIAVLLCCCFCTVPSRASGGPFPPGTSASGNVSNMVLVYFQPPSNPFFNTTVFRSLVGYTPTKTSAIKDSMFDSFLFTAYGWSHGKCLWPKVCPTPMNMTDWLEVLDVWTRGFAMLNDATSALRQQVPNASQFVAKVYSTLIPPDDRQRNFGVCCGPNATRSLDFILAKDRQTAIKWFIEETASRFAKKKFPFIELVGFYWFVENINSETAPLVQFASTVIHSPQFNLKFTWIPYFTAAERSVPYWKTYGFDWVTIQPNFAFSNASLDRFSKVNDLMIKYTTGVEFELALYSRNDDIGRNFTRSFYAYVQAAKTFGWIGCRKKSPGAIKTFYYGNAYWEMASSTNATIRRMYDVIHDDIIRGDTKC